MLDTGAETVKPGDKPAYGLKVITFGSGGTGCAEPVAKFTVNGKKEGEEPTVKPGETVTFSAAGSELLGGFRKELIWKFGDGTEKAVGPRQRRRRSRDDGHPRLLERGQSDGAARNQAAQPPYGDPAPVERAFSVGTPTKSFKLTVSKSGAGKVTSSPGGIDCGGDCEEEYSENTEVTLVPAAEAGSEFKGWSGACSGTGSCKVTMSAAKSVGAEFALEKRQLSVTKTGNGTVTSSPAGIDCGVDLLGEL